MTPARRKIIYAVSFELIGILVAGTALQLLSVENPSHTFSLAAAAAALAMTWSYAFNSLFEGWESRQGLKARTPRRRAAHAVLFEVTLLLLLVPMTAIWLSVSLWTAIYLEGWLIAIFIVYTYLFTLSFDLLFGPPLSAR